MLFRSKNQPIVWNDECQEAFFNIKNYLLEPPILVPPVEGRPLIMYLSVLDESMGCVLGQQDETGKKEHAIYYLSKKFTDCQTRYTMLEKTCCALAWASKREPLIGEGPNPDSKWGLVFDGAVNAYGRGIGAVIVAPQGHHIPFTARIVFECTNNVAEYEACILGIEEAIDMRIKHLDIYGDSALVVN